MTRWMPIETAPRDRKIIVYAPAYGEQGDLPDIVCFCEWHPDAGFCIDELRQPTHWIDIPKGY